MQRLIRKENKVLTAVINIAVWFVFIIPVLLEKIKNTENNPVSKILVLELWGMGDVIMMSSVLKPLRNAYPQAKIYVLAKSFAQEILQEANLVDHFVVFDFPWTKFRNKYEFIHWPWRALGALIKNLRQVQFDLVLDARDDIRNNILSFLTRGKRRVGYATSGGGFLLTDPLIEKSKIHRVQSWQKILSHFKITEKDINPSLVVPKDRKRVALARYKKDNTLLIGIHPGAAQPVRRWPQENFQVLGNALTKKFPCQIVQFIDPDGFGRDIRFDSEAFHVQGSLEEMAATLSVLDLLICNDTGVMHMATALNIPVVAIFGPGDVDLIGPYGEGHRIVIKEDVPCRPCFDYCRFKRPFCILDLPFDEVDRAVEEKIRSILLKKKIH